MRLQYLAASLLLAAPVVMAAPSEPAKAAAADSAKIVCFVEPTTGSHIKKRVCMTEAEHDRRRKEDQDAMRKLHSGRPGASSGDPKLK